MDKKPVGNKYSRVMPRVLNRSRSSLKSSSSVVRHEIPTSVRVAPKASVPLNSSDFSELPIVLNDYVPESSCEKVRRTFVVKPRKTVRSLDPSLSPQRVKTKSNNSSMKEHNYRIPESAPSVLQNQSYRWSDTHLRQCYSSRSHKNLKELKDEISAYHETDKLMKLRSRLYKNCGVVLDDVGHVAADKAIQVEAPGTDNYKIEER